MKKFSVYIAYLLFTSIAFAQVDRSKYPEPGPAPQINIGEAENFTLPNGLKVFVVENHKLPRVTYSLVLDRDPIFEGEKAGYTAMVGDVLMGGTKSRTKDQLDEEIDMIGGSISFSSTGGNASSLSKHQEKLLTLFSDILLNPLFPQAELDKVKKQTLSGLEAQKNDPDAISSLVANRVLYGKDHPYGESETEKTVNNIELEDIKQYYGQYFRPNIAYLAIVGDITKKEAEKAVKEFFSSWQKGDVPKHEWGAVAPPEKPQVILVDRPTAVQSVLDVTYPIEFAYNSPDRIPVSLLNYVLGGGSSSRLFMNLREKRGYTYGAYSSFTPDRLIGHVSANASVRSEVTDSAAYQLFDELRKLKEHNITDEELSLAKASATGSFGRSLEQPATIASFAINTERYDLPKDYYKNYLKNVDAVTLEQINKTAVQYSKPENAYLVVVGNANEFKDNLDQFGEVKEYSNLGEPIARNEVEDLRITAEAIIENYLKAIGGREKLQAVNSIRIVQEAEAQGMKIATELAVDQAKKIAVQTAKMGGQVLSKIVVTEEKAIIEAQGQQQDAPKEVFAAMKASLSIFPELHYSSNNSELTLEGTQQIGDENAYELTVVNQDGFKVTNYYSVESGLKLKSSSAAEGEATFESYNDFDGIQFPVVSTVENPNIPIPLKMVTQSIAVNVDLSGESEFK